MNVLVTGGTGFLGRHMVDALLDQGHTVLLLSRSKNTNIFKNNKNLNIWKGNFTIPDNIEGITKNIDIIYHFAAQLGEWGVPNDVFYSVNVNGTKNLLDACVKNHKPRFIFVSTPGVQGKGIKKAKEYLPYNPPYIYERTKCDAEKLVLNYHNSYGLPIEIIRPDFVYGPGDYRRISLYRAIQRRRFLLIGNGKSILHPTYIDDVIQGLMLFGQHNNAFNEIFNIAGPEQLTVENYIHSIAQAMGGKVPRIKIPVIIGKIFAMLCESYSRFTATPPFLNKSKIEFLTTDHGSDISKAKQMLGFHPRYSFDAGFNKTYKWAIEHNLL